MEQTHSPHAIPPIRRPSRYSIFKRIANLILVIAAVLVCINLWLINSEHADNWYTKQTNQLGNSLTTLSADLLTTPLLANDSARMIDVLSFIVQDKHVAGASLYDNKGRLLAENNTASSVVAAFKLKNISPLVFVRRIIHDQQTIGYLNVVLEKQQVMNYHAQYQHQINQQLQMLVILGVIAGILATRVFYKIRYRRMLKDNKI